MTPPVSRFAPAPTGFLHLGHVVNAIYVWGVTRAAGGRVLLRVEDHDRGRSRPEFERAILDDLDWLGFVPDEPSTDAFRAGPVPGAAERSDRRLRRGPRAPARGGPRVRLRLFAQRHRRRLAPASDPRW